MLLPSRSDCYTDTFLGVVCDFQLLIIFLLSADYKMQFKALNHLDSGHSGRRDCILLTVVFTFLSFLVLLSTSCWRDENVSFISTVFSSFSSSFCCISLSRRWKGNRIQRHFGKCGKNLKAIVWQLHNKQKQKSTNFACAHAPNWNTVHFCIQSSVNLSFW